MFRRIELTASQLVASIVVLSVVSGSAAGVAITTLTVNDIRPGSGTLSAASSISIDSQDLTYEGNNVTAVDVVVNNTGGSSVTVDIHVALKDSNGNKVDAKTVSGQSIGASSTATVTASMGNTPGVDEFQEVEVTVEQV